MSMPIQRQSESFGYFDDGPRHARDRSPADLPKGLAGLVNGMGPRIQGGMLNTRTAAYADEEYYLDCPHCGGGTFSQDIEYGDCPNCGETLYQDDERDIAHMERRKGHRLAVNTDGMHPDDHAYHTELPPGRGGEVTWVDDAENYGRNPRREWNPDFGYEPTDEDERRQEGVAEDDDSGYNWGPEPRRASRHPFDRTAACQACGGDVLPDGGDWSHVDAYLDGDHEAEPDDDDLDNDEYGQGRDPAAAHDEYEHRMLNQARLAAWADDNPGYDDVRPNRQASRTAAENVVDPAAQQQMVVPAAGGYQPGHRVGLPWRDQVVRGTVIGLDGDAAAIRWDDGQYSSEEPHNIQLL